MLLAPLFQYQFVCRTSEFVNVTDHVKEKSYAPSCHFRWPWVTLQWLQLQRHYDTTAIPCDPQSSQGSRTGVARRSHHSRVAVVAHDSISVANLTGLTFLYKLLSLQLNNVVYKSCDSCPIFMYIFYSCCWSLFIVFDKLYSVCPSSSDLIDVTTS